jgi:integrase
MELEVLRYDKSYQRIYENALAKITEAKDIIPENKRPILEFLRYLDAKQSKPRTKMRYVYTYEKLIRCLPSKKLPLLKATRPQLEECVININNLPLGEATKTKIRVCLKAVYKHFNGDGGLFVPKEVAFVSTMEKKGKERLTYSDLLNENEISKLLDNTLNPRDAFLIALMADAPLRTHEILRLQRKHLYIESNPAYLIIPEDTKTGTRRIPLVNSIPFAVQYLKSNKGLKPEDPLFLHEVWNKDKKPLTYAGLRAMLHKVAIRAGIDPKRVFPYAFRHRWLSMMASKVSNATLENVAGWIPGTNMHQVYQHMSPNQNDIEIRKAYGVDMQEGDGAKLRARITECRVCNYSNSENSVFCSRCGRALDVATAFEAMKHEGTMKEAIAEALKDPKVIEEVVHSYLLMQAKKKHYNK